MRFFLFFVFFFLTNSLFAEGSADLYPRGVRGARAYLVSGRPFFANGPIENGTHYVWVKKGETIAVASSAQGIGNGYIEIGAPSGSRYRSTNNNTGRIEATSSNSTREAELAGPRIGYTPYEVIANEEGIWSINFYAPYNTDEGESPMIQADANWTQLYESFIAAWDISVRDIANSKWLKGRVFANLLTLSIHSKNLEKADGSGGYYGKNFVLTNDAAIYRVDANGNHGLGFAYFANNSGFIDSNGQPLYKSINHYDKGYHYPILADNDHHVTHKLFYNFPDKQLPKTSQGRYPGNQTWLLNEPVAASIANITLIGTEGKKDQVSKKGAWINFNVSQKGRYRITISSLSKDYDFITRELFHLATPGVNKVYWDGLDGANNFIPIGKNYPVEINITMLDGEVHFPFLDIEVNPQGLLVERFSIDEENLGYVKLYWDDSQISPGIPTEQSDPLINLKGILSNINGHKWGSYKPTDWSKGSVNNWYGSHSFGNGKGMDTWTYKTDIISSSTKQITVSTHDLKIVSIVADKSLVSLNESYSYTVTVRNEGPSDIENAPFIFSIPPGMRIDNYAFLGECAAIGQNRITPSDLQADITLPNGCEIVFKIDVRVIETYEHFYSHIVVHSSISRTADTTDPDATKIDINKTSPGSAQEECSTKCNNIQYHDLVELLEPINERGKIGLRKTVYFIDNNQDQLITSNDILEYRFEIKNLGEVPLHQLSVSDKMLSDFPIWRSDDLLPSGNIRYFTFQYFLSDTDIKNKKIINSAEITARNPRNKLVNDLSGITFEDDDPTLFSVLDLPKLYLTKRVNNLGSGEKNQFTVGDTIFYSFIVKHEGIFPINKVTLIDRNIAETDIQLGTSTTITSISYTGHHIVSKTDILKGRVLNSARIKGIEGKYNTLVQDISGYTFADDNPTETLLARPYLTANDVYSIYQGERITIDFLDNDQAGSSSLDHVKFLNTPIYGRLIPMGEKYQYIPYDDTKGIRDSLSYQIIDKSRLSSNISSVIINVEKTQAIALNDSASTHFGMSATLYPLRNDYSKGSVINPSSLTIVSPPQFGTLVLGINGALTYTPHSKFTGLDHFEYQILDKNGNISLPASFKIEVTGFKVPNVITPNEDGLNDVFFIIGANNYDKLELTVINRHGSKIFSSDDYQNDWIPGSNIEEGTYYYILKIHKKNHATYIKKGNLLIIRGLKYKQLTL